MNHRRLRIERCLHVSDSVEFLILDQYGFCCVLGLRSAGRHHTRDGLTLPAHAIDGDRMLEGGFEALEIGKYTHPWRDDGGKLLSGDNRDHPRHSFRGERINLKNFRMRIW